MGTCLAVIKVTGTAALGIYAGVAISSLTNYEILTHVLATANSANLNHVKGLIRGQFVQTMRLLTALGSLASSAFILAYSQAPRTLKHPYLIYASLVTPLSSLIYYGLLRGPVTNYLRLKQLQVKESKEPRERVVSELDNSVYKDLGDVLTTSDEDEKAEDEEISEEVEFHLTQKTIEQTLERGHLGDKVNAVLGVLGFVIATVGLYGDH